MQQRLVALVRQRAQDLALLARGVRQHAQRLVGVAREEDVVEALGLPPARVHDHRFGPPSDQLDRRVEPNPVAKRRHELLHVARRTAADHSPRRPVVDREHAVVVQEADEEARGKIEHARGIGRPNCRTHGHEVVGDETAVEPVRVEVCAKRALVAVVAQQCGRFAMEAEDLGQHAEEARP